MKRILLLVIAVASLALCAVASAAPRFVGFAAHSVSGGQHFSLSHDFQVGSALDLIFRDNERAKTDYKVCWAPTYGSDYQCWRRRTGRPGQTSDIHLAAPNNAGQYNLTWTVRGRVVARQWFYNGCDACTD